MNADQIAMDRLGDFLKLLAQGCHVRVSGVVYKLDGVYFRHRSAILYDDPNISWKLRQSLDMSFLLELFEYFEPVVVYRPSQKSAKRNVRSIEL